MSSNILTVCLITYNHEKYITQCIESVLMQKTNFDWDIVIADDSSTDKTRAIILSYKEKFPKKINLLFQEKNVGPAQNFEDLMRFPNSEFIAYIEGDDYWITDDKLQKQFDILNRNQHLGLVYTNVKNFIQNKNIEVEMTPRYPKSKEYQIPMMLESKYIEFSTTMFRKSVMIKIIDFLGEELRNGIIGDTRILLEFVYHSEVSFLNEATTAYRISDGSASRQIQINKYIAALLDTYYCRKVFVERYKLNHSLLSNTINNTNRGLINRAFIANNYIDVLKLLKNIIFVDLIKYSSFKVFSKKMKPIIWAKLILSFFGVGVIRQLIK